MSSTAADRTEDAGGEWAGERVERWLAQQAQLEVQLAPIADALFDAARLQPGEIVLDVGCGSGPVTLIARRIVGTLGRVTGLDVSPEMIDVARSQIRDATIDWIVADAVQWRPLNAMFDAVISRFGIMFFSDPATAFANLATATVPGGRLAAAVWTTRDESDLFGVPLAIVEAAMRGRGIEPMPLADDEGPFSLGRAKPTVALLTDAGWSDVTYDVVERTVPFGGELDAEASADFALAFGPSRLVTADLDGADRSAVRDALVAGLTEHVDQRGVVRLGVRVAMLGGRRA